MDPRADRTALRLKLYENGFTPLANKNKMCLLPGWSTFEVTPDLIRSREWARSREFADTGLRCGDIVAVDLDVNDKALFNELADAIIEQGVIAESPFVRVGKAPRELWVYRTADKIGKRTTGHFKRPDAPENDSGEAVEVLGAGCQFGAFGFRSEGIEYTWPVESPLDHHYMDLPEITLAQVEKLKDFCAAFFESHGLERKSPGGGTDAGYTHAYDLTDDMVFDVKDIGPMSVADMTRYFAANPGQTLRCEVNTLRPTTGSWAAMVSFVNDMVCLSDHGTYTSHFPASALNRDDDAAARLGRLLAERFPEPVAAPAASALPDPATHRLSAREPLDDNLAKALRRYVYVRLDDRVHDLCEMGTIYSPPHFKTLMAPYYHETTGKKGGINVARLSELWFQHTDRIEGATAAMRPDKPVPLFEENGQVHLNTYREKTLPTHGSADEGFELLENLLPRDDERAWFIMWLACKVQRPEVRGPGVIMVAQDAYGTGRGSLISLMTDMFGETYVRLINFNTITGRGSQSQYNQWLSDSLIVCVDEAQDTTGEGSQWRNRHSAYEHLKSIIDPGTHKIEVTRKTLSNYTGKTFASVFIATNHSDALVIPRNDRRIGVLENGQPMPAEYWARFHAWRTDPANVGAFREALRAVSLDAYNPYDVPLMTSAKSDMVDAGLSDLDRAVRHVISNSTGALMVKEQVVLGVEEYIATHAVDLPDEWRSTSGRVFAALTRKLPGDAKVRLDGKLRPVRFIPGRAYNAEALRDEGAMLEEVNRNGPIVRPVAMTGKVLPFGPR